MNINCQNMLDSVAIGPRVAASSGEKTEAAARKRDVAATEAASKQRGAEGPVQGPYTQRHLNGLQNDWGQANSPYDLNGDGTVNTDDLIMMITNWQQPPAQAPVPGGNSNQSTLDAINQNWGQSGPAGDVNGDGIVNTDDIIAAITNSQPPSSTTSPPSGPHDQSTLNSINQNWGQSGPAGDVNGDGIVNTDDIIAAVTNWQPPSSTTPPPTGPYDQSTLNTINQNWGQSNAAGDINGDGLVNTDDILAAVTNWSQPAAANATPANAGASPAAASASDSVAKSLTPGQVRKLSAALLERLSNAGFDVHPPANLREIMQKLNLSGSDYKSLLEIVRERYPDGLGVNMTA